MPYKLRRCVYTPMRRRIFRVEITNEYKYIDPHHIDVVFRLCDFVHEGELESLEFYVCHTYHTRPVFLIERASNTAIRDVMINSAPGMGVTAMHAKDILLERISVVPSPGDHFSTNTDATHFASCRGKLRIDSCTFEGQGDDMTNVHTYYYVPKEHSGNEVRVIVETPDGTHTQSIDHPEVGDRFEMVDSESLMPLETYTVKDYEVRREDSSVKVVLDRDLPDFSNEYLFCDPDEVPDTEVINCNMRGNYARSILIKSRKALLKGNTITDVFETGIKVAAEAGWREGINTDYIEIRDNRLVANGYYCENERVGISVTMDSSDKKDRPQGKIIIEDNYIDSPYGDFGIYVSRAKEVKICRNVIATRSDRYQIMVDGKKYSSDEDIDLKF